MKYHAPRNDQRPDTQLGDASRKLYEESHHGTHGERLAIGALVASASRRDFEWEPIQRRLAELCCTGWSDLDTACDQVLRLGVPPTNWGGVRTKSILAQSLHPRFIATWMQEIAVCVTVQPESLSNPDLDPPFDMIGLTKRNRHVHLLSVRAEMLALLEVDARPVVTALLGEPKRRREKALYGAACALPAAAWETVLVAGMPGFPGPHDDFPAREPMAIEVRRILTG